MPGLAHAVSRSSGVGASVKASYTVNEVVGDLNIEALRRLLEEECGATRVAIDASSERSVFEIPRCVADLLIGSFNQPAGSFPVIADSKPRVISVDFQPPSSRHSVSSALLENGTYLSQI